MKTSTPEKIIAPVRIVAGGLNVETPPFTKEEFLSPHKVYVIAEASFSRRLVPKMPKDIPPFVGAIDIAVCNVGTAIESAIGWLDRPKPWKVAETVALMEHIVMLHSTGADSWLAHSELSNFFPTVLETDEVVYAEIHLEIIEGEPVWKPAVRLKPGYVTPGDRIICRS